jgi:esterase/lipase superfamily enzyme
MLGGLLLTLFVATTFALRGRRGPALLGMGTALVWGGAVALLVHQGRAAIEKEGVTYTGGRGELVRGLCEVTIPDTHQRGEVERPQLLRLELSEDLRRHVVLKRARELPAPEFFRQLAEAVESAEHRDLFVFIHGYNVDFDSAVRRTAQIAVDLPFRGVPVCYSWPSQASLLGYKVDENNVNWTTSHLKQFLLELVAYADADSINLVAHSMGNRALTAALRELSLEMGEAAGMFDRVVLAAPDIDADHFRRDLAPHLLNAARHVTLYASSGDRALIASKQVHGYPRAGESGAGIVVVPGVETIDVSGIDLSLLGHSYYGDSQDLLHDLFHIVREALPAAQRSWLLRREKGPLEYWQLSSRAGPTLTR